jgi:chaperonin GroES
MKIRPLHDRVVVKRVEEEEKTESGLYIPDTAKEKPIQGDVIAVGDGKVLDNGEKRSMAVKEGDRVVFAKYAGTEIEAGGETVLVMREDDIMGVVE